MQKSALLLVLFSIMIVNAGEVYEKIVIPRDDAWTYMYRNRFDDAVIELEKFIADEASLFRIGYSYIYSSEPQNAVVYLLKLPDNSWKFYAIGLAYYKAGKYDKATEYLSAYKFEPHLAYMAQKLKYDALKENEDFQEALKQLKYLRSEFPSEIGSRRFMLEKLRIYKKSGQRSDAILTLNEILKKTDSYSTSAAQIMKDAEIPKPMYRSMADAFYNGKKYSLARKFYEKYLDDGHLNGGNKDGKAIFRIARCNDKTGRYTIALGEYRKMKDEKLFNEGWAIFGIVRCLRKLGRHDEALKELKANKALWENSTSAPYVLWEGYEIGRETKDYALAAKYAGILAKKHTSHDLGDNGVVQAGIFHVMDNDYEKANEYFSFIYKSPKFSYESFKNIGRYWSSRIDVNTKFDDAQSGLPDFYTYHRLADSLHRSVPSACHILPDVDWDQTIDSLFTVLRSGWFKDERLNRDDPHLRWGRFFAYWGMAKWASIEYEAFLDSNPDIANTIAALELFDELRESGITNLAYEIGLDIVNAYKRNVGEPPMILYRLSYPVFFEDILNTLCPSFGVDPLFVLSVMRQESRYDPDARSWANARGLMQVIPKTGNSIARSLSTNGYETIHLYDPYLSVEFGAFLLGDLIKRMGDHYAAAAAYNAGEAPVKRWKSLPIAEIDPLVFTEIIDYKQTRHYVRHVMENYFRYYDIWY
ncbi:MAG: transglycosylase SLT domain-containing protein [Candidatus Zixiibacteriota bacterium]